MEKSNEFKDSLDFPLKLSGFSIHSNKRDVKRAMVGRVAAAAGRAGGARG